MVILQNPLQNPAREIKTGGMGVCNGTVDRSRVSSLWVENNLGIRHVEIGWYEDPVNDDLCLPNSDGARSRIHETISKKSASVGHDRHPLT